MLNDDKLPIIKIILLGEIGVDKSAKIKRYINNSYATNFAPTIISNFLEKIVKVKNENIRLEIGILQDKKNIVH